MMDTNHTTLNETEVRIPCPGVELQGDLVIPIGAKGLVVFAHGCGSSRKSPRNRWVAGKMHEKGLGTLLFDLLSPEEAVAEAHSGALRFNIPFLTRRLLSATCWAQQDDTLQHMRIGYFGSSTGAAALSAAAESAAIRAVVSRGGRTDLAGDAVERVQAPTLLIVGSLDEPVVNWNRQTLERLPGVKRLALVEGATHLFEESGALEQVAELTASWLKQHLGESS